MRKCIREVKEGYGRVIDFNQEAAKEVSRQW